MRQNLAERSVGTGCQLWLASMLGVLWSPVTISTSGLSAVMRGTAASNSSVRFTFAAKLPSSPVLSVYLKWMKKKSYFDQFCFEHGHLLVERLGFADDVHADESGEAFVHRVDGDRGGAQAVDFFVARQLRLAGEAAEREAVGFRLAGEQLARLADEFFGDFGGLLAVGIACDRIERRHAGDLRVGVVHVAAQALAAEHDDEAMFLHRFDEDFDAGDLDVAKPDRERRAFFGRDAAGAAVGDVALGVDRAEVGADGDVAVFELEADAGRFERAAADHVLQRVVAEQAEVARAAAGADAGQHRDAAAEDAGFGERVEVRRFGRFQFGQAARLLRQAAEAVGDVHDDLGVVFDVQFASEFMDVHGGEVGV